MRNKGEKFFFDVNVFDEGFENEDPDFVPPPVFTEQQLEEAKKKSFEDGKRQGLKESQESQLQLIAATLQKIHAAAQSLFEAEALREKSYEAESVRLTLQVFEKLFPYYQKAIGFEDLKGIISDIIKKQEGAAKITIHVSPGAAQDIETHLQELKTLDGDTKFIIEKDEAIPWGACKIYWSDGGAVRNPQLMSEEIKSLLQHMLAAKGASVHDEG